MSALLPLQIEAVETGIHVETDGTGPLTEPETGPVTVLAHCSGCGRCVSVCPEKLFSLVVTGYHKTASISDSGRCTFCLKCVNDCPVAALACRPF
ncbi:MAG TPA: 4Fe-4S binding protein [Desulfuromonadales bacterium]|nr:4Fe-4S binding protein [Desulfuromonadales bacterium]